MQRRRNVIDDVAVKPSPLAYGAKDLPPVCTLIGSFIPRGVVMLHYAVVFLVIALIAGILGFTGIAGASVGIAKILFFVFLILFALSFVFSRRGSF